LRYKIKSSANNKAERPKEEIMSLLGTYTRTVKDGTSLYNWPKHTWPFQGPRGREALGLLTAQHLIIAKLLALAPTLSWGFSGAELWEYREELHEDFKDEDFVIWLFDEQEQYWYEVTAWDIPCLGNRSMRDISAVSIGNPFHN
jgi:hypothetical protein